MGREYWERTAVNERCRCEARSAYLFPNISPCSYRARRLARPLFRSRHCSAHLILPLFSQCLLVASDGLHMLVGRA